MSMFESIVDQDRDEHRSAARHDTARYRWVGNDIRDAADVPSRSDLADEWGEG
jgi:hypothetical protein